MQDGRYKGLLDDIANLESFEAIAGLTQPNLSDFQSKDLLHALAVKAFCCMYDTGMGKTFVATAYMQALKNQDSSRKFLMFGTNSQLDQTVRKIQSMSNLKVICYNESPQYTITENDLQVADVILLSHGCLTEPNHVTALTFYLDRFFAVVIDEMHLVSNFVKSRNAQTLQFICSRFEYILGLTATPITTDVEQLARCLYMINPSVVNNWKDIALDLKNYGASAIDGSMRDLYVVRQRPQNNHRGVPLFVNAMQHQLGAKGQDLFEITKGPNAVVQHEAVKQVIDTFSGQSGLIYANRRIVQTALCDYLTSIGYEVAVINGDTKRKDRESILDRFRNGEYDAIITNIKESLDMDCQWVLFYEFTPHVKQFIGRAERGFTSKNLPVMFLFTRDTDEYDYFYRNVYLISQAVQDILKIDFKEVTKMDLDDSSIF